MDAFITLDHKMYRREGRERGRRERKERREREGIEVGAVSIKINAFTLLNTMLEATGWPKISASL